MRYRLFGKTRVGPFDSFDRIAVVASVAPDSQQALRDLSRGKPCRQLRPNTVCSQGKAGESDTLVIVDWEASGLGVDSHRASPQLARALESSPALANLSPGRFAKQRKTIASRPGAIGAPNRSEGDVGAASTWS